jgi:hypothetical protein
VNVAGWGFHADAKYDLIRRTDFNTQTVNAMLFVQYDSEVIDMINPGDEGVELRSDALTLLKTKGPAEFHKRFGTHFVSGYTKGAKISLDEDLLICASFRSEDLAACLYLQADTLTHSLFTEVRVIRQTSEA